MALSPGEQLGAEGELKPPKAANCDCLKGTGPEPQIPGCSEEEECWGGTPGPLILYSRERCSPLHQGLLASSSPRDRRKRHQLCSCAESFDRFSLIPGIWLRTKSVFCSVRSVWNYGLEPFLLNVGNKLCRNSTYTLGKEHPIKYKQMFVCLSGSFMGGFVINCVNVISSSNN